MNKYLKMSLKELHEEIKNKRVLPSTLYALCLQKAKESDLNPFVTLLEEHQELDDKVCDNPLFGIPYAAKDNFSTKGIRTTGSSKMLDDYIPLFDADVITALQKKNAMLLGKTVLDELAMGGTGTNGHTGITRNPWNRLHRSGGSSGGSAVAVAAGIVPYALGSDTGDSVRKPAAYCGIVGFKPTWGRISRFGVFPFAPSLDHVAYFTRTVEDSAYILSAIAGVSPNDTSSSLQPNDNYLEKINHYTPKNKKFGYIKEIVEAIDDQEVKNNFFAVIEKLKQAGVEVTPLSFDPRLLKAIYPVYNIISCCEATSNNANLDGIKFGLRAEGNNAEEIVINTRSEGFSTQVKQRFIIGAFCLSSENQNELFIKAQRVRNMIVQRYNQLLAEYDVILTPASGSTAPKIEEQSACKLSDHYLIAENHLALANFAGTPSITIPSGFKDGLPLGVNLTSKAFSEGELLGFAHLLEGILGYKNIIAKEEK